MNNNQQQMTTPLFGFLLGMGIFLLFAVPPLAVVLLIGAFVHQASFRSRVKTARRDATDAAQNAQAAKYRRERILALKAM